MSQQQRMVVAELREDAVNSPTHLRTVAILTSWLSPLPDFLLVPGVCCAVYFLLHCGRFVAAILALYGAAVPAPVPTEHVPLPKRPAAQPPLLPLPLPTLQPCATAMTATRTGRVGSLTTTGTPDTVYGATQCGTSSSISRGLRRGGVVSGASPRRMTLLKIPRPK